MKNSLLLLSILTLCTACSSTPPTHFIINPVPAVSANSPFAEQISINVTDNRARQDVLQRSEDGKKSYLTAQLPTTSFIKAGLTASFQQSASFGINIVANPHVDVNIEKMAIKLEQSTLSYETKSLVVLAVTINHGTKTLNKTFKRQGTSKGPLTADIAVLEQEFNQLLSQLFNDISHDQQVIKYLTKKAG